MPGQFGNWLESYAQALDLNVWTSSTVIRASQDEESKWHVTIRNAEGTERKLIVDHLVFATGTGGGVPSVPKIPRQVGGVPCIC